jgi:hypothetical protein
VSAVTDRLGEDDVRWLARMFRVMHARHAARIERERAEREPAEDETRAADGDRDAT